MASSLRLLCRSPLLSSTGSHPIKKDALRVDRYPCPGDGDSSPLHPNSVCQPPKQGRLLFASRPSPPHVRHTRLFVHCHFTPPRFLHTLGPHRPSRSRCGQRQINKLSTGTLARSPAGFFETFPIRPSVVVRPMSWPCCFDLQERASSGLPAPDLSLRPGQVPTPSSGEGLCKRPVKPPPLPSPPSPSHPRLPPEWHGAHVRLAPTPFLTQRSLIGDNHLIMCLDVI
ncbi:hypothetical protein B0T10DRAFT_1419 [Thelonectria olida]|uniref:Uncharacterized protein n=1 Tax=Thelonectria olida TaxID=1576542 RepID=A0A9P9AWE2_9HYPO|nr:hypothetical protein B0T10DRAFT_1419 [Thelonectria olida]